MYKQKSSPRGSPVKAITSDWGCITAKHILMLCRQIYLLVIYGLYRSILKILVQDFPRIFKALIHSCCTCVQQKQKNRIAFFAFCVKNSETSITERPTPGVLLQLTQENSLRNDSISTQKYKRGPVKKKYSGGVTPQWTCSIPSGVKGTEFNPELQCGKITENKQYFGAMKCSTARKSWPRNFTGELCLTISNIDILETEK